MTYLELQNLTRENSELANTLYICSFFDCNINKMKTATITIVQNIFGKYIVTEWLDYEYGKYRTRKEFSNKDSAAAYAWNLLNNNQYWY